MENITLLLCTKCQIVYKKPNFHEIQPSSSQTRKRGRPKGKKVKHFCSTCGRLSTDTKNDFIEYLPLIEHQKVPCSDFQDDIIEEIINANDNFYSTNDTIPRSPITNLGISYSDTVTNLNDNQIEIDYKLYSILNHENKDNIKKTEFIYFFQIMVNSIFKLIFKIEFVEDFNNCFADNILFDVNLSLKFLLLLTEIMKNTISIKNSRFFIDNQEEILFPFENFQNFLNKLCTSDYFLEVFREDLYGSYYCFDQINLDPINFEDIIKTNLEFLELKI